MGADPGLFALKSALRAAIVVPLALALSLEAVGSEQMALSASFGAMALLVFVDFGGPRRARLRAYLLLLAAGVLLIVLGTLCSRSVWAATAAMAIVAFAILFAGVLNDYIAAAHSGAMLTFVLPVMVPATVQALPMRLAGWGLAGALSLPATLLLWPQRPRGALRRCAARAAGAIAELLDAGSREAAWTPAAASGEASGEQAGDRAAASGRETEAHAAVMEVRHRFLAMQHRPSGTASRTAALARLVDDLGWLYVSVARVCDRAARSGDEQTSLRRERSDIKDTVPSALRALQARLDLGEERGSGEELARARDGLGRVREAHERLGRTLVGHAEGWREHRDEALATRELDEAWAWRQVTFATMQTGRDALLACGEDVGEDPLGTRRARIGAARRTARAHASMRSVWLRNSMRGAAGLALAVLVGQLSDVQHAFWIVLGTMSVLRSSALATGATIVQALLGTLAGIVVGGLLVALVGDDRAALWAVLPVAVLLAAYAPRAVSFAAGQGAFSLTVLLLFNLLMPAGWRVGLVRVEDVAIGAGVSLLAGVLIWPRGAAAVLREAIGHAYDRAAEYLDATVDALLAGGSGEDRVNDGRPELCAREAGDAAQLLDATVREYLADRGSPRESLDDLTALIVGATRVRRVARLLHGAQTFARLAPIDVRLTQLARVCERFETERGEVCGWYAGLGVSIAGHAPVPPPAFVPGATDAIEGAGAVEATHARVAAADLAETVVLERPPGSHGLPPGLAIAWAHRHMRSLGEFEPMLAAAGIRISGGASAPERRAAHVPP